MRLIDADELIKKMLRDGDTYTNDDIRHGYHNCQILVYDAPTVDAEPIRHGHWEYNPKDAFEVMFELPKCSVCGHESSDALKYCSNCGALMDEEVEE